MAGPDERWGRWLDHVLRSAGHEVAFYRRSFPLGANFVDQINAALARADRMIAVISPSYLDRSSWVREEWQAGMRIAHDRDGFLLPVLVEPCELPPLLGTINMIVLAGLDQAAAAQAVLRGLLEPHTGPPEPGHEPPFPGYDLAPPAPTLRLPATGAAMALPAPAPGPSPTSGTPAPDRPDLALLTDDGVVSLPGPAGPPLPPPAPPGLPRPSLPPAPRASMPPALARRTTVGPGPAPAPSSQRPPAAPAAPAAWTRPPPSRSTVGGPATSPAASGPAEHTEARGGERASITLLHLPALAVPPRPGHAPDTGQDPYGAALLDDLAALAANPGITPDLVVVTGVAVEGRRGEYEQAGPRLAGLAERLGLPVHRIALVPGRGDVSAAAARAYFAACEDEEIEPTPPYWRKWRHFVDFHAGFYRELDDRTFAVGQEWTLYPMPDLRLVVVGLNSTMTMSHRSADDRGEVGQAQARWFADRLAGYERAGWFRVAIGHHPPLAADRVHSAKAADADGADLILGGHLNVLLAAHGHGAPAPNRPLPAAPARLPRSGTALISAHPPHPVPTAEAAVRYQLVRVSRSEVTRLDRRFSRRAGAWRPADEVGPGGTVTYRTRWEHAAATFPRPTRRQPAADGEISSGHPPGGGRRSTGERGVGGPPTNEDARGTRRGETFADRVAEIAELSSPGATVTRISPVGVTPEYLRVTVPHGPVFEQRPVGIAEEGVDEGAVDRFVEHVHHQYAATDPQLTSDLVYGGPLPAPDELVRHAAVRGVRLRSFVEYQGLLDLRGYLRRQSERLAADRLYPPALYLPQRFRLIEGGPGSSDPGTADGTMSGGTPRRGPAGHDGGDLLGQIVDWLTADSARFVLILGDFGRGKTFCLHELARTLPQVRPHLIPLLIDLRTMEKAHSVDELVAAHLVASGEQRVDVSVLRYMLRRGRLVLLFDGFDELALRVTYETAAEHLSRLLDAVEGQAKIVVSSRTQHFLSHGQVRGALGARVELLPASRIAEVGDFTEQQIEEFLVRLHHGDAARARERLKLIHDIRDLLGLSHNPRMLGFIASLDTDRLRAVQARTGMISSADLYGELIGEWLRHEEQRARPPGAGPTLTADERREAVTALALRLWRTTDQMINLSELAATTSATLDAMTDRADAGQLDSGQAAHMVGSGSLLVRAEDGGFTFIHQSVMEYLVAAAAAGGLTAGTAPDPTGGEDVLAARAMSPLMVDFVRGVSGDDAVAAWARRVLADPDSGQAARANALTIARRADPTVARGARLAGAHLEGADLAGLDLTGADLRGANLTDANLDDTALDGADLTHARLTGVRARGLRLTGANLTDADLSRARLADTDLTDTVLTGSRWARAALLGATPPDRSRADPELAAAAVPGRDPVDVIIDAGVRLTLAISPAHDLIAYGSGHHVALSDLADGRPLAVLRGHGEWIRSVAFSADGSLLAAGDIAGSVRIWDVTGAEELATFDGLASRVRSLAFSPEGRLLAAGCWDGEVYVWDLTVRERIATLRRSRDRVKALCFSPDGTLLAYGDQVHLWDVRARRDAGALGAPDQRARASRFSPDGRLLAWIDDGENTTRVWSLATGGELARLPGDTHLARTLAFNATSSLLAVGAADGTIRVWDPRTGGLRATLRERTGWLAALDFVDADGETLIAGSADGTVRLWKVADGSPPGRTLLASHTTDVVSTVFVPDQPLVASANEDGSLRLWDTRTARQVHVGSGERAWTYGMDVTDDATLLAASGEDGLVRIFDLAAARSGDGPPDLDTPARKLNTRRAPANAVAFSPDTTLLAVGHPDGTVGLWNPWTGRPTATLRADGLRVLSVAFSPDGERLAAGTDAGTVHLWDAIPDPGPSGGSGTAPAARRLGNRADQVNAVAFSPDGQLLASAFGSGTVRIWDAASGELRHRLVGHTGRVRTVAFSPDGRLVASGGEDGIIRVWDTDSGAETRRLAGHTEVIRSLAFAPGRAAMAERPVANGPPGPEASAGDMLVSGGGDGTTRLWDVAAGREMATLLGLSGAHWAALFPDGAYKSSEERTAEGGSGFSWSIRLCRFDPDELTPYLPWIRRLPLDAPIPPAP
ncbi:TIR domain-containing protein [Pseudofrankia sp. BMG5.37]|uniref:WD40 domain-containing protein n=1 Tax=Pseudofrankia sp. BMG5.37 TaxID=3050035 RepID=UPI0028960CD7|nr:TIR domain-containing protein [Pseudofrankia sp. BMG5.37]MDT3437998.1 TIR domain-containing protein [Pseudofrankia sp. BMG5.37]